MHLMKNIFLILLVASLVTACSSGTTVSPLPANVTQLFQGTFQNNPGTESGTVTLNIQEDASGVISGTITFNASPNPCLRNSTVAGNSNGFNLSFTADQTRDVFTIVTTVSNSNGVVSESTRTSSNGTPGTVTTTTGGQTTAVVTTVASAAGVLNATIAISNNGSTLSGTYFVDGEACSNQTGSGTMNLST